jgi:hypothetical protein
MRLDEFDDALGRWEAKYTEWVKPINQFAQAAFFKINKDGYSLADFEREREAIEAHERSRYDPGPEIEDILDRMCSEYLGATPTEREQCRSLVRDRKGVLSALIGYVHSATERLTATKDINHLRRGLAAVSIENCAVDYRDNLVALADIWLVAERAGFDPSPHFRDVAKLSSDEDPQGGTEPVSEVMRHFQDYAILSSRRAKQAE